MNSHLRAIVTCLFAAAASLGCSSGALPEVASDETGSPESVVTVEQAVGKDCINQCMLGCVCRPEDGKPPACRRLCLADCTEACSTCTPNCTGKACGASDGCGGSCSAGSCRLGTTCGGGGVPNQCGCTASCTGKACGASDGCGGTCTSGSCPGGAVCGGGGTPGVCPLPSLPNLNGVVTGTLLASPFITKQVRFDILVRNMGPAAASNVELLFQTNSPAAMSTLITSNGFVCHSLAGYSPRLGLACTGGNIGGFNTASIQLTLAMSTPGFNVLSMIADPYNAIVEINESDNLSNGGVTLP